MRKGYQRGIALIIVIMLFLITGCGTESRWLKKSSREENESRSDFGFQKENPLSSLATKDEERAEEEDLQTLDTLASAVTTAVADQRITTSDSGVTFTLASGGSWQDSGDNSSVAGKITVAVKTTLGAAVPSFSSNNASGKDVKVFIDTKNNIVYAYLPKGTDDTHFGTTANVKVAGKAIVEDVAACRYNDNAIFCISNGKVEGKGEAK